MVLSISWSKVLDKVCPSGKGQGSGATPPTPPEAAYLQADGAKPPTPNEDHETEESMNLEEQLAEQERLIQWLQEQLERQRAMNSELRRAVADLARTFQESLAAAYEAGESGDIEAIRRITRANQQHWQGYLQQIVAAARTRPPQDA